MGIQYSSLKAFALPNKATCVQYYRIDKNVKMNKVLIAPVLGCVLMVILVQLSAAAPPPRRPPPSSARGPAPTPNPSRGVLSGKVQPIYVKHFQDHSYAFGFCTRHSTKWAKVFCAENVKNNYLAGSCITNVFKAILTDCLANMKLSKFTPPKVSEGDFAY